MSEDATTTIRDIVTEKAVDGRIPCAVLRKAAEDLGVSYEEAGAAANDAEIKVANCERGCF
jgi:hypothetical protein